MSFPIIGITSRSAPLPPSQLHSVMVQQAYTNAIINAGGIPLLIPSDIKKNGWKDLTDRLDGILFTGGGDIGVEYFNGEQHPAVYGVDPARDEIELGLARLAVDTHLPFLGICRGLQIINVALGGTLYTHIPDQLEKALVHEYPGLDGIPARTALLHAVTLEENSQLRKTMAEEVLLVNSLHHQGIKDVAATLKAAAFAPDGLVEAVELLDHPFGFAVQWHPEWLTDQTATQRLFKAFVDAAAAHFNSAGRKQG